MLIIEGSKIVARLFAAMFEKRGWKVVTCNDRGCAFEITGRRFIVPPSLDGSSHEAISYGSTDHLPSRESAESTQTNVTSISSFTGLGAIYESDNSYDRGLHELES